MSKNLVILIVSFSFSCFAQKSNVSQFNYDGSEFSSGVNKFINKNSSLALYVSNYLSHNYLSTTDSLCTTGVALIKFKLSNTMHVSEISCSKETPQKLSKIYKEAVEKSSQYWKVPETTSGEFYVLPFHYNYFAHCNGSEKIEEYHTSDLAQFDDGTNLHDKKVILLTSGGCYHGKGDRGGLIGMPKN